MTQTLLTVAAFVLLLAMVPMAIKWVQGRGVAAGMAGAAASRVLSAVAVGPQQRLVTVEVGPAHDRVCLVLGVTAQSISCLHTSALGARADDGDGGPDALTVARPGA